LLVTSPRGDWRLVSDALAARYVERAVVGCGAPSGVATT